MDQLGWPGVCIMMFLATVIYGVQEYMRKRSRIRCGVRECKLHCIIASHKSVVMADISCH